MTSHKIPFERSMTLEISLVSRYNQVMAKTDTKGIDAKIEPKNELCFAISETATMIIEVIKNFNTKYVIKFLCIPILVRIQLFLFPVF